MKLEISNAKETRLKTVAQLNPTSGRVYLPHGWVGKRVMVVLLDE